MEREALHRREQAYYSAALPRLKRFPSFQAFVGDGQIRSAPAVQTPEQMEAVMDQWAFQLAAMTAQQSTLSGVADPHA